MVLTYHLYRYPYKIAWQALKILGRNPPIVCYCGEPVDHVVFETIQKHLPPIPIVSGRRARPYFESKGIRPGRMPAFPQAAIMFRHAAHKFPEAGIIKIGLAHGAYRFKRFTRAANYNAFDVYMATSSQEVEWGKRFGIKTAVAVGSPKLDPLFDGTYDRQSLDLYRQRAKLDPAKPTVIFTATWDGSGMSAVDRWVEHVGDLTPDCNILATVHPWTSQGYIRRLRKIPSVYFIEDPNIVPYLAISDLLVGDCSSIIAEFCTLNRPIVTFRVGEARRSLPEIFDLLDSISTRIEDISELPAAIEDGLKRPDRQSEERQRANRLMFDNLDGKAGQRAAAIIRDLVPALRT
jgi:CDP-glycerol glycerophosphotransferase (TagB/SpsB family)